MKQPWSDTLPESQVTYKEPSLTRSREKPGIAGPQLSREARMVPMRPNPQTTAFRDYFFAIASPACPPCADPRRRPFFEQQPAAGTPPLHLSRNVPRQAAGGRALRRCSTACSFAFNSSTSARLLAPCFSRRKQSRFREFQNLAGHFLGNRREALEKFLQTVAFLQIFEQRADRNARPLEDGRATQNIGIDRYQIRSGHCSKRSTALPTDEPRLERFRRSSLQCLQWFCRKVARASCP